MRKLFVAVVMVLSMFGLSVQAETGKETTKVASVQSKDAKLNINTASAQQIAKSLNGVGIKKAEAIVAYRTQNGPFKSTADLMKVKGMGSATLQKNVAVIAFN